NPTSSKFIHTWLRFGEIMRGSLRIKLAKPPSVKLVIKNINDSIESIKSGVTDKYNLFIVVESVNDAWRIASAVEEIKSINLGGIKAKEGSKNISKAINLLPEEIEQLQQLVGKGVEVEIRQVPNDRKQLFAECV
ncbi:PTS sugar transporter subunit IIB, partial [Klebsiella oxytoca]|uniref:PTS sugar transporter subunit IIB n=1 Tax=Klebsiella oxytoca TaxID=571 RepID=UPI001EEEA215